MVSRPGLFIHSSAASIVVLLFRRLRSNMPAKESHLTYVRQVHSKAPQVA